MAVIGKIREKSTLLLIVVGGALMAFVLTDLFSSRGSVFGGDLDKIGVIDGHEIRSVDFNARYEKEIENYKTNQNTSEVPDFVRGQLREQIWNRYIDEFVMGAELEKLGVMVSSEELGDMIYGDNPHPQVRQAFTNPETGVFNKNDVINFLKNLDRDETGKTKNQWLVFENAMKEERRQNKYFTLISKGLFTTTQEAKEQFEAQNKRMTISFVAKRYNSIPDSAVSVSESDIKNYYKENANRFQEKKARKILYAVFNVVPSVEDSVAVKQWVDETHADFKLTEDDSSFVNANSDREFDFRYYSINDENPDIDTMFFKEEKAGITFDPVIEGENWKIQKISKIKFSPDSVEARHILLSFTKENREEVEARLDSIKQAIEAGTPFSELAAEYSIDPGSKEEGGDLGWFKEGYMIPVINDSCFNAEVNKLMVVESAFGLHLIEVTAKSDVVKKLQVATILRSIDASRETVDQQFTKSNDFSLRVENNEVFEEVAGEMGIPFEEADVLENDNTVPMLESSRGLVRWAYNAEVGQVSEALQYGSTFVVAKLLEIHEDGTAPLENVRAEAEIGAIKDKKAEKFLEEMSGYTDLDQAASALALQVERAEGIVFESFSVPVLGREPEVLGRIYTMDEGDLSVPIKGENGVYIVRIDDVEEVDQNQDFNVAKFQLSQNRSSRVTFEVKEALKERVEIQDNRYKIY